MKTIDETEKAKIRFTKTWGWEVIEKNVVPDHSGKLTRGKLLTFGKTKADKKEAEEYYNEIKS